MIDLALNYVYFLGAALLIGVATARWAFAKKAEPPGPKQDDEAAS
jgi:hypothetical protein